MAVYCLFQKAGLDIFSWSNSPYEVVGTFSNPNFLASYLMITSLLTFGFAIEGIKDSLLKRAFLLILFAIQFFVITISGSKSALICVILGLLMFFFKFWEIKPGKIIRNSPFIPGIIIAIVVVLAHGIVFYSTSNYPWQSLGKAPTGYFSLVSRLMLWQMGFSIFLQHPTTGMGPGATPYLMPLFRPKLGTALGLKVYNDDPHSAIVSILSELGFFGLFAVISFLAVFWKFHSWKQFKQKIVPTDKDLSKVHFSFFHLMPTVTLILISAGLYSAGFFNSKEFFFSIPILLAITTLANISWKSDGKKTNENHDPFAKTIAISIFSFVFYSFANNTISVQPLMSTFILILSLHSSVCLRDIQWKRKFSYISLAYLFLPVAFVFSAYVVQATYQSEQTSLFKGAKGLRDGNYELSANAFEEAIRVNPQSLQAHFGLAQAFEKLSKLNETQETLKRLDGMVPNAFNTRFEMARILFERKMILEAHRYALQSLDWSQAPSSYELLGKILVAEGRLDDAQRIFEEGLFLIPVNSKEERIAADRIRISLASIAARKGQYQKCEELLSKVKTIQKNSGDSLYLQGLLKSRKKDYKNALKFFELALKKEPKDPRYMNAVGFILASHEINLERAQILLENAQILFNQAQPPFLADLLMISHSLGILYWKQGKIETAQELLTIAYAQCPKDWVSTRAERFADLKKFLEENGKQDILQQIIHSEKLDKDKTKNSTDALEK